MYREPVLLYKRKQSADPNTYPVAKLVRIEDPNDTITGVAGLYNKENGERYDITEQALSDNYDEKNRYALRLIDYDDGNIGNDGLFPSYRLEDGYTAMGGSCWTSLLNAGIV